MISFLLLIFASAMLLGMGIKHDELAIIVMAYTFGLFIAYSYGRYVEYKRTLAYVHNKLKEADRD